MNVLDVVIVVLIGIAAFTGYRRGAALQISTYAGLLLGLLAGALVAPHAAELVESPLSQAGVAIAVLLLLAALGDGIGSLLGRRVWALARHSALAGVDAVGGSLVAVVAVLLATWFLGFNLVNGPIREVSREVRGSVIIRGVDRVLPRPPSLLSQVRGFLNRFGFPEVFAGLPPAPAGPVEGPTKGEAAAAAAHAELSTVRIVGHACDGVKEGSGFFVDAHYVVTNAHVVAGVGEPRVQQHNGGSQTGVPVLFDAKEDIAVLRVPNASAPALALKRTEVGRGRGGAALGYPGGGGLTFVPAAVRRELHAVGRDIYGRSVVGRDVYELQAVVRPGNSGGPFVLKNGDVAGVIFAASTSDPNVGYAITSPEVIPLVRAAESRAGRVDTGPCVR